MILIHEVINYIEKRLQLIYLCINIIILCNLCCLSSCRAETVVASRDEVSLLMPLYCKPLESFKAWMDFSHNTKKSIPRTAQRSWIALINSRTFFNLWLCQTKKGGTIILFLAHRAHTDTRSFIKNLPFLFVVVKAEHKNLLISSVINQTHRFQDYLRAQQ